MVTQTTYDPDWLALWINSSLLVQREGRSPPRRQRFDTTNYFTWKDGHPVLLGSERPRTKLVPFPPALRQTIGHEHRRTLLHRLVRGQPLARDIQSGTGKDRGRRGGSW